MPNGIILVVEDDPTLQMVARLAINRLGYACEVVGTAEDALKRIGNLNITMIFMDIGLPGISGIQATLKLREKEMTEQRRRIPIIGLTGHAAKDTCLKAGMDDFLQKPALMKDLQTMINKWIESPK